MTEADIQAVSEDAPVRRRRTFALAVMIAASGLVLFLAIMASFLWLLAAPFALAGVHGTWTGLQNKEILNAVMGGLTTDSSVGPSGVY